MDKGGGAMKNLFRNPNVQAAILLLVSIAEIVIVAICRPISGWLITQYVMVTLLSVSLVRFAYPLAWWHNYWHTVFHRKNSSDGDDEPSDFAVIMTKAGGYFCLIMETVLLIIWCTIG